jgi:hypothetical protein
VVIGSVMIAVLDVTSGIGRGVCFAIALFSSVVLLSVREYRFRRTHPPEERAAQRAALAAKKQLRQDRRKSVAGSTPYKRKVLRTGAEARAVITAAHDLESATEYEYWVYLELAVTVGADPPYTVCTGEMCSGTVADMSSLWVGRELVVRVDLTDRQRVAVDWKESVRLCQAPLSGTYTYESSSGNTATWTITPSGPGSVNVASAGGPKAPFYGTAQSSGQTWTMVVHRPDVVKHRRRRGDTGSGTSTFTWDAITLRGKGAIRTDEGVFGRPARQLNTVEFTLTKI